MKFIRRLSGLVLASALLPSIASASTEILFVLDSSGSMKEKIAGQEKIDLAKAALVKNAESISEGNSAALRVFAHRVDQANKSASCQDTELLIPFGPPSTAQIQSNLGRAQPKGYTPLAYTLEQAPKDFSVQAEAEKVIIVLSDGEETCGGDPVAVVQKLRAQGFNVTVHTVGFDVDAKTRAQLEAIAKAGGGSYFDAKDAVALQSSLEEATKQAIVKSKKKTIYGTEVKGGDSYESAVPIPANTELRLDHHQAKDSYDYFWIDMKKGQELRLIAKTGELGAEMQSDGRIRETGNPYMGLQLVSSQRQAILSLKIFGQRLGRKEALLQAPYDGRYYVLVGFDSSVQHKDGSLFEYSVTTRGDLGSDVDAGVSIETALPITAKRYEGNFIGGIDEVDTFKFTASKGDKYLFGIIPIEGMTSNRYFSISVNDDFQQEVARGRGEQGKGFKSAPFEIPADGEYTVAVNFTHFDDFSGSTKYTFELRKLENAAPASEGSAE